MSVQDNQLDLCQIERQSLQRRRYERDERRCTTKSERAADTHVRPASGCTGEFGGEKDDRRVEFHHSRVFNICPRWSGEDRPPPNISRQRPKASSRPSPAASGTRLQA